MRSFIPVIMVALAAAQSLPAQTGSTFVAVTLPHGVSVAVPAAWAILSHDQPVALDPVSPWRLDLSRVTFDAPSFPFEAHLSDEAGRTVGMVSVRYFPHLDLSQIGARGISTGELHQLDVELEKEVRRDLADSGISVERHDPQGSPGPQSTRIRVSSPLGSATG